MRPTPIQNFDSKIAFPEHPDGCAVWVGSRRPDGYGVFAVGGRLRKGSVLAHRRAWEREHGPIPECLCVCHKCDNPPCVNPAHLFLGTRADNNADMEAKGRGVRLRGERNGNSKITPSVVVAIRSAYAAGGVSQRALARSFGLHQTTIGDIVRGETWRT